MPQSIPPLHMKDVGGDGGVSFDRLATLPVDHHESKALFHRQRRWADDESLYEEMLRRDVGGSRTTARGRLPRFAFSADDAIN